MPAAAAVPDYFAFESRMRGSVESVRERQRRYDRRMRFETVLFDLDGTVVDSGAIILASMRHATREVLGRDYIRAARARGVPERAILLRHALPNFETHFESVHEAISQGYLQVVDSDAGDALVQTRNDPDDAWQTVGVLQGVSADSIGEWMFDV